METLNFTCKYNFELTEMLLVLTNLTREISKLVILLLSLLLYFPDPTFPSTRGLRVRKIATCLRVF